MVWPTPLIFQGAGFDSVGSRVPMARKTRTLENRKGAAPGLKKFNGAHFLHSLGLMEC
jgi:hypothetical protein